MGCEKTGTCVESRPALGLGRFSRTSKPTASRRGIWQTEVHRLREEPESCEVNQPGQYDKVTQLRECSWPAGKELPKPESAVDIALARMNGNADRRLGAYHFADVEGKARPRKDSQASQEDRHGE
jgi:hypothetical protein